MLWVCCYFSVSLNCLPLRNSYHSLLFNSRYSSKPQTPLSSFLVVLLLVSDTPVLTASLHGVHGLPWKLESTVMTTKSTESLVGVPNRLLNIRYQNVELAIPVSLDIWSTAEYVYSQFNNTYRKGRLYYDLLEQLLTTVRLQWRQCWKQNYTHRSCLPATTFCFEVTV